MTLPQFSPDHCPDCGIRLSSKQRDGRERLFCSNCDQIVWLNPKIAAGFIVQKGENVLLQKRGIEPHAGKWSIPAGYLELDEKPLEGAKRELEEETGLKVTGQTEFVGHISLEHPDENRVVVAVFHVDFESTEGEISPQEEEVEELEFWNFDQVFERKNELDYLDYLDLIDKIRG